MKAAGSSAAELECERLESRIFWRRLESRREPQRLIQFSGDPVTELALLAHDYESALLSSRALYCAALREIAGLQRTVERLRAQQRETSAERRAAA